MKLKLLMMFIAMALLAVSVRSESRPGILEFTTEKLFQNVEIKTFCELKDGLIVADTFKKKPHSWLKGEPFASTGWMDISPPARFTIEAELKVDAVGGTDVSIWLEAYQDSDENIISEKIFCGSAFQAADSFQKISSEFEISRPGLVKVRVLFQCPRQAERDIRFITLKKLALLKTPLSCGIVNMDAKKNHVRIKEEQTLTAEVANFSDKPQTARLRTFLEKELNDRTELSDDVLNLKPKEIRAVSMRIYPEFEYGCAFDAQLEMDGKIVEGKKAYFGVSDNVYKIGIQHQADIAQTRLVDLNRLDSMIARGKKFGGNELEVFAWPPGDNLSLTPAPDCPDEWESGQLAYKQSTTKTKEIVRRLHENGIRIFLYTTGMWMNGKDSEIMRQNPEWYSWNAKGQPAWPNASNPEIWKRKVQEMIRTKDSFGWDGFRFDGHPTIEPMYLSNSFDFEGRPLSKLDWEEITARNLEYIKTEVWKQRPDTVFGFNYTCYATDPDKSPIVQKTCWKGSMVMNECFKDSHNPASIYYKWKEFSDSILREANRYVKFGGIPLICMPSDYFNNGATNMYEMIFVYAGRTHAYGWEAFFRIPVGDFRHFVTRYSSLIWADDIRPVEDPEGKFRTVPADALFDRRHFFEKDVAGGKQYIIHLINPPVDKCVGENKKGELPKPIGNLVCSVNIPGSCAVESITLLTPDENSWSRTQEFTAKDGICEFRIPELKYWNIAVINLKNK